MRIGLIARSDNTGLGNQTRNLARMLHPDEVMLINSTSFNGNKQYPEKYDQYNVTTINGFPSYAEINDWLKGLDVVVTCEVFYSLHFVDIARDLGVKTVNHYNWEFADYLRNPSLSLPDKLLSPSKWNLEYANKIWGNVSYLPTPIFIDDFVSAKEANMVKNVKKRFLHIMGKAAVNDRNGTEDLVNALKYCRSDFELVIKSQIPTMPAYMKDPRITFDNTNPKDEVDLYKGFDAMIIPRRYGGQCLPMTEALCAGLPVIMTDISPNNTVLPPHWLVKSHNRGGFMARTWVELYSADLPLLAERIDQFAGKDLHNDKLIAYNIGYKEFSNYELERKWEELLEDVCRTRL